MDWIGLAQDSDEWKNLVNAIMNIRVPQNAGKFLSSCTTGVVSREELNSVELVIDAYLEHISLKETYVATNKSIILTDVSRGFYSCILETQ
jgi:hypothetical protein